MDPLLISLVSACTALVTSVVGPIVTLAVARRQFNANVLSANRQKWIEELRDVLSEGSHDAESEADIENITRLAQSILKREWERVKRGTWEPIWNLVSVW